MKSKYAVKKLWLTFHISTSFKDIIFCSMAFWKIFYEWPFPGYTRQVRLDWILCWYDEDDIYAEFFNRDTYREERITISPGTLTWTILFDDTMESRGSSPGDTGFANTEIWSISWSLCMTSYDQDQWDSERKWFAFSSPYCYSLDVYCWWTENGGGVLVKNFLN